MHCPAIIRRSRSSSDTSYRVDHRRDLPGDYPDYCRESEQADNGYCWHNKAERKNYTMNRREFLSRTGAGLAWLAAPTLTMGADERRKYLLRAEEGFSNLVPDAGVQTAVWQYNRQTPGPVIRIKQGATLQIPFTNNLKQPTSIHWHGLRISNRMDGVPGMTQSVIEPGAEFLYELTPPDAGTFWYHTHNRSWEQLARGLYGVLIVEEKEPIAVDQDLVWVIDDWLIDKSGNIDEASLGALHDWAHGGRVGNLLTVNGKSQPEFPVFRGERIRLRLVNVANARTMYLRFTQVSPQAIAIDGQPIVPTPLENRALTLAPGQRIDLILDMTMSPGQRMDMEFYAGEEAMVAASLVCDLHKVVREVPLDTTIRLSENPLSTTLDMVNARTVDLSIEGGAMGRLKEAVFNGRKLPIRELIKEKKIWAMNGIAGLSDEPLFSVKRGETVVIQMDNQNRWPHAMHIHGHHFINIDEGEGFDVVWRDTFLLNPNDKKRLGFVADNPGKWLIHCHMIEHQAGGMVTWFEVV